MFTLVGLIFIGVLIWWYVRRNDKALTAQPANAFAAFSPNRVTAKEVLKSAAEPSDKLTVADQLPPRTGRRYIVVGGVSHIIDFSTAFNRISGWLFGWVDRGAAADCEHRLEINIVETLADARKEGRRPEENQSP